MMGYTIHGDEANAYDMWAIESAPDPQISTIKTQQRFPNRSYNPTDIMQIQLDSTLYPAISPMNSYMQGSLVLECERTSKGTNSQPALISATKSTYVGPMGGDENGTILSFYTENLVGGEVEAAVNPLFERYRTMTIGRRQRKTSGYGQYDAELVVVSGGATEFEARPNEYLTPERPNVLLFTLTIKNNFASSAVASSASKVSDVIDVIDAYDASEEDPKLMFSTYFYVCDNTFGYTNDPDSVYNKVSVGITAAAATIGTDRMLGLDSETESSGFIPLSIFELDGVNGSLKSGYPRFKIVDNGSNNGRYNGANFIRFRIQQASTSSIAIAPPSLNQTVGVTIEINVNGGKTWADLLAIITAHSSDPDTPMDQKVLNYVEFESYPNSSIADPTDIAINLTQIWSGNQHTEFVIELGKVNFTHSVDVTDEISAATRFYESYADSFKTIPYESIEQTFMQALPCTPSNGVHGAFARVTVRTSDGRILEQSTEFNTLQSKLYDTVDRTTKVNDSMFSQASLYTSPTGFASTGINPADGYDLAPRYFTDVVNPASASCQGNLTVTTKKLTAADCTGQRLGILAYTLGIFGQNELVLSYDIKGLLGSAFPITTGPTEAQLAEISGLFVPGAIVKVKQYKPDTQNSEDTSAVDQSQFRHVGWSRVLRTRIRHIKAPETNLAESEGTVRLEIVLEASEFFPGIQYQTNTGTDIPQSETARVSFERFPYGLDYDDPEFGGVEMSAKDLPYVASYKAPFSYTNSALGVKVASDCRYDIELVTGVKLQTELEFQVPIPSLLFSNGRVVTNLGYGLIFDIQLEPPRRFFRACEGVLQGVMPNKFKSHASFGSDTAAGLTCTQNYYIKDPAFMFDIIRPSPQYADMLDAALKSQNGLTTDYIRFHEERKTIAANTRTISVNLPSFVMQKSLALFVVPEYTQSANGKLGSAIFPTSLLPYGGEDLTSSPVGTNDVEFVGGVKYAIQRQTFIDCKRRAEAHVMDYDEVGGLHGLSTIQFKMFFEDNPDEPINLRSITNTSFVDKSVCPTHLQHLNSALRILRADLACTDNLKGAFMFGFPLCKPDGFKVMDESNMEAKLVFDRPTPTELTLHFFMAFVSTVSVSNNGNTVTTFQ